MARLFDALGDYRQTEALTQPDDGPADHGGIRIFGHPCNETAIDLENVQGKLLQIT